uniref:Mitochondrial ATP synthase regulatory component factor B n=1 Tax=Parascaris univalens TaxID=6257 RepID=A0A915BCU6_PARUN
MRWRLLRLPSVMPIDQHRRVSGFAMFRIYSMRRRFAEMFSNKFRVERVEALGPDLACLEWLMECGCTQVTMSDDTRIGSISEMRKYIKRFGYDVFDLPEFDDNRIKELKKEYFSSKLSSESDMAHDKRWSNAPRTYIVKVDASDSAVADPGFAYFRECRQLDTLKLNFCDYFGDEAIRELALGRPARTLTDLEIVLNPAVTDGAIYWLTKLKALRRLHFYFLPYVSNRQGMLRQLRLALPRCRVTFPREDKIGYGYE